MTQIQQDIDFVKSVLPSHYIVRESRPERRSIHCISSIGIEERPPQLWENILDLFKNYFGDRFQEVFHNVCANHTNFSIYLKKSENQQKQQHMTPLSKDETIDMLTASLRDADIRFQNIGGSTRHYVRDLLLPMFERQGICMYKKDILVEVEQSVKYTDHGKHNTGDTMKVKGQADVFIPHAVFGIGTAVDVVQAGKKIARQGWNGRNMFVYYVPAGNWKAVTPIAEENFGAHVPYNHYLAIKNPDGTVSTWAPSGSDALAKDWYIVE